VFEKTVAGYKKCVPSLPKDHSWPILVAHATMSICISNIYDDISNIYDDMSQNSWGIVEKIIACDR